MSQLYYSASSKYLIFYAIISVLIFQAMARHRFHHNNLIQEQGKQDRPFEKMIKKQLTKYAGLLFLKPSSINRPKSEQLNHETPPLHDDIKVNTSCGRINCENVTNYPLQLIKDLLEEQTLVNLPEEVPVTEYEDEEYDDETGKSEEPEVARAITFPLSRSLDPTSWLYPNENPDQDNIPRNEYECKILADIFREEQEKKFNEESHRNNQEICKYKLRETKPRETIDREKRPFTLVNDDSTIVIKGYECTAGLDCYDRAISIGYKYHCKTHWEYRDLCTLNNDGTAVIQKKVAIADGCDCTADMIN